MRTYFDVPYTESVSKNQMLDIYLPDSDKFDMIIWLHGGGLESGNRKNSPYAEAFVKEGFAFASVEYRLYPEAHFPEFIEDAADAAAWIIRNKSRFGNCERIYVSGESAGAYLTMMLCMDQRYLETRGIRQAEITGYISDSAQQFCHYNILRELGMDTRLERIDEHAPIYFLKPDMELRPLCLIYYEDDLKCRPEETKLMYASIRNICPDSRVEIVEFPGGHCCKPKASDGEWLFVKQVMEFIAEC